MAPKQRKYWLLGLVLLLGGGSVGAATDAFFAGRAIRMTRISAGKCVTSAYSCFWFDVGRNARFWDGVDDLYVPAANTATPTSGKWVLVTDPVDGGAKWIHPTDGGLVLP